MFRLDPRLRWDDSIVLDPRLRGDDSGRRVSGCVVIVLMAIDKNIRQYYIL